MAKNNKKKKRVTDIGNNVPSNFKFGVIVAIALFWTDFLKSVISLILKTPEHTYVNVLVDLLIAVIITVAGVLVLYFYRKIYSWLKKVKF